MFTILTLASTLTLIFLLSYRRHRKLGAYQADGSSDVKPGFIPWMFRQAASILRPAELNQAVRRHHTRISAIYPEGRRWIFTGLVFSFAFLALTGFSYALIVPGRLHGIPLVLHIVAGGIFATSLSLVVIFRAGEYAEGSETTTLPLKFLFWMNTSAGLSLAVTALLSTLSFFPQEWQHGLIQIHRYGALLSLLAVLAFTHFSGEKEA